MEITNIQKVEAQKVDDPGAEGVTIRWLISEKDGAPHFAMRLFEVKPDGYTPYHQHKWEHEVFILEGKGNLVLEDKTVPLNKGDALFVPGEENHQFKNTSPDKLVFLCLVPIEKQ
jgi:quercetin dioxygenase-like cupin family protein